MEATLKKELHQLIDNCNNEVLLTEAKEFLQSADAKDWWDGLNEEDKNLIMESEAGFNKDNFINHKELMQQFEEWF